MIEANTPLLRLVRGFWPLVMLSLGLLIIVAIVDLSGDIILAQTLVCEEHVRGWRHEQALVGQTHSELNLGK